jgi:sigma-B regulation protein RsbU (phosphoserine phosphatase)
MRLNRAAFGEISTDKFITLCLAVIDTGSGIVRYSSAGHPYPMICGKGAVSELELPGTLPLGVLSDFSFPSRETTIASGSSLLMYSDGIIEARSPDGDLFGRERLSAAFLARCAKPTQEITEGLMREAHDFSHGHLNDDVALLVVRRK